MASGSHPRIRKAVIPAAGHGTRLLPLTQSQPKEMVACGPAPVIQYVLDELRDAGISQLLLISRSGKGVLEDFVFLSWPGACVTRQPEPRGLGDAVLCAADWVGDEPFVVALGDTIIRGSAHSPLQRMLLQTEAPPVKGAQGSDAQIGGRSSVVLVREVPLDLVSRYGVIRPGELSGALYPVRDIIEKPEPADAPSRLAVAGRYLFTPAIFDALRQTPAGRGGELQVTDAMRLLCGDPTSLYALPLMPGERRFDIGDLNSYYEAFAALSGILQPQPRAAAAAASD